MDNNEQTEVKFLRLITGEDIITEVMNVDEDKCVIINPMKILYTSTTNGYMSISLMQWVFTKISNHQTFDLPKLNILTTTVPNDSLVEYYWETVDSFFKKKTETRLEELPEDDDVMFDTDVPETLESLIEYLKLDKRKLN